MSSGMFGMPGSPFEIPVSAALNDETNIWATRVALLGGTLSSVSLGLADGLINALQGSGFNSKIRWLAPLLGNDILAASVPLRDYLGTGAMTNTGYVNADFSESTGLKGGASKRFTLSKKIFDIMGTGFGGLGFWDNQISATGLTYTFGALGNDGNSYNFLFGSGLTRGAWANPGLSADLAVTPTSGHFYVQGVSNTSRTLYKNGSAIASSSAVGTVTSSSDNNMVLMGDSFGGGRSYLGRCAVAYATDNTMTSGDIAALHTLLNSFLITPTGR